MELTSRVNTDQVAEAKAALAQAVRSTRDGVDVALATNMISVGLDITRLGLMVVQGQPKTAAEYIQATSRVGRDKDKPGLVVTLLNVHKPRDRLHYERFRQFHAAFYRAVEATSVTPWAARALDRALAAVVVAMARHMLPEMTHPAAVKCLADPPRPAGKGASDNPGQGAGQRDRRRQGRARAPPWISARWLVDRRWRLTPVGDRRRVLLRLPGDARAAARSARPAARQPRSRVYRASWPAGRCVTWKRLCR